MNFAIIGLMKILSGDAAEKLWDKYWDEMRSEWFRLEVLQDYSGEDAGPSLDKWLKGDKEGSLALLETEVHREWVESCQEKLAQGVKLVRIHVAEEPYSPYLEWELMHYEHINVPKCGERVFLVNRTDAAGLDIPPGDLMIFDNNRAVVNAYDQTGMMVSETFYDENDDVREFIKLAGNLMEIARPLT